MRSKSWQWLGNRSRAVSLVVGLSALGGCGASVKTVHDVNILPLRSVRLYETGIGYFERAGTLGSWATVLPVPAGHLDDALKSLSMGCSLQVPPQLTKPNWFV